MDSRKLTVGPGSGGSGAAGQGGSSGGALGTAGSPPPLQAILLGDFENDIAQPQDSRFGTYQYAFDMPMAEPPPGAFVNYSLVSPGFNSNYALSLNWEAIDLQDGIPTQLGASVFTEAVMGYADLSGYDRIEFAQNYQHSGNCQAIQALTVTIGCGLVNGTSYVASVPVSASSTPTWTTSSILFSSFVQPSDRAPTDATIEECLGMAGSVVFDTRANVADGDCFSGSLALDDIEIRAGSSGSDAGASAGIPISPDAKGAFDGNGAGVIGAWWSAGDFYGPDGTAGSGTCPSDGFPQSECSLINAPTPGRPFLPDGTARMCTNGVAAAVAQDSTQQPAYSAIWGNAIGFDLNRPPSSPSDGGPDAGSAPGVYDAIAHGITGFAFDLDGSTSRLRVEFLTQGTEDNPAYWDGSILDLSPVSSSGHYEIRWADVGGPMYLPSAPPFDPSKLESIRFHVPSFVTATTSYAYCIKNTVLLTGP